MDEILTSLDRLSKPKSSLDSFILEKEILILMNTEGPSFELSVLDNFQSQCSKTTVQTITKSFLETKELWSHLIIEAVTLIAIHRPYFSIRLAYFPNDDIVYIMSQKSRGLWSQDNQIHAFQEYLRIKRENIRFSSKIYFASKVSDDQFKSVLSAYFKAELKSIECKRISLTQESSQLNSKFRVFIFTMPSLTENDMLIMSLNYNSKVVFNYSSDAQLLTDLLSGLVKDICKSFDFTFNSNTIESKSLFKTVTLKKKFKSKSVQKSSLVIFITGRCRSSNGTVSFVEFLQNKDAVGNLISQTMGVLFDYKFKSCDSFFDSKNDDWKRQVINSEVQQITEYIFQLDSKLNAPISLQILQSVNPSLRLDQVQSDAEYKYLLTKKLMASFLKLKL